MQRTTCLALTLVLLATLAPAGAQTIDEGELNAKGWQKVDEGFWQKPTEDGGIQTLAYGTGKQRMIPRLQTEIERILESFQAEPTADKAEALEALSGHLASLLEAPEPSEKKTAISLPLPCEPWDLDHSIFTFAYAPPGWHGILATASAYWDGGGLWCPGHVYARASFAVTPSGSSTITDLDWCTSDDNYAGGCWAGVNDPWVGPYTSCTTDAYAYMTLFNGLYVLDETKHWGTC